MEPTGSFGPRLRQERERRQISLSSIAANTKISESLLAGLERDDVSKWPSGIFRRSFVRAYAAAIGLNGDDIVREFTERFPDPSDAPPHPPAPAAPSRAAEPPARVAVAKATPPPSGTDHSDRIELVFRISVPRSLASWVTWLASWVTWLTSLTGTIPRRQNT